MMSTSYCVLNEDLFNYVVDSSVREPESVGELGRRTAALNQGWWRTSAHQGQFMAQLAQIAGVRRYLELGTFTGYGTLWMALALPPESEIVTCELSDEFVAVGRPYWAAAGIADKISVRIGPALETLAELIKDGHGQSFDMAFVDADKENYPEYYEYCLMLVRPGGLVVVDNVLWGGAVIDSSNQRRSTQAIRALNTIIRDDQRVTSSILTIGDGLTLVRKLP